VPDGAHDPLEQTLGVIEAAKHPEQARAFVEFMRGPDAQAILARFGFGPPGS